MDEKQTTKKKIQRPRKHARRCLTDPQHIHFAHALICALARICFTFFPLAVFIYIKTMSKKVRTSDNIEGMQNKYKQSKAK